MFRRNSTMVLSLLTRPLVVSDCIRSTASAQYLLDTSRSRRDYLKFSRKPATQEGLANVSSPQLGGKRRRIGIVN
ncbi:hypothetical protein K445DRAFT_319678 [Daldinia sp. EC12]|nr:hypothetical protein K445DRAFT_319678 [Daldinia sp. EC12]